MHSISMVLRVRGQGGKECWQPRQNHLSRTSVQHEVHSTTEICHDVSDHHSPGVSSSRPIFSTASAQKEQKTQNSAHLAHIPQHRYVQTNTGLNNTSAGSHVLERRQAPKTATQPRVMGAGIPGVMLGYFHNHMKNIRMCWKPSDLFRSRFCNSFSTNFINEL